MKCPGCNSTIPEGASFCPECGQKIEKDFEESKDLNGTDIPENTGNNQESSIWGQVLDMQNIPDLYGNKLNQSWNRNSPYGSQPQSFGDITHNTGRTYWRQPQKSEEESSDETKKKASENSEKNPLVTAIAIAALVIFIGCAIAVTLNNRQNSNKVSTSEPVSMAEKNISYIQG